MCSRYFLLFFVFGEGVGCVVDVYWGDGLFVVYGYIGCVVFEVDLVIVGCVGVFWEND